MPSLPKAELIGVFLESLAYGAYFLIFVQCMQVLRQRQTRPSDYLLATAVSLFILATAHLVIDILHDMDAFTSNTETANYADTYFASTDAWKNVTKSTLYVAVTIISDAFIVYRTFIVWGQSYFVAVIPFLLFLADIGVGILWVYTLSLISPGENIYAHVLAMRIQAFYLITLGMNVMCTCLIAFRIWRTVAQSIEGNRGDLFCLVAIVVESGSVYSAVLVIMIATYANKSSVMFVFQNTMPPIIGIVFSSVIVRIGKGLSHGDSDTHHTKSHTMKSALRWAVADGTQSGPSNINMTRSLSHFSKFGVQVALSHTMRMPVDGLGMAEGDPDHRTSSERFVSSSA